MPKTMRLRPLAFSLTIFFAATLWPGSAVGKDTTEIAREDVTQEKVWNQAEVTQLAIDLEQTLEEAYGQSLNAPRQPTAIQQRERDAAQAVIRRARDLGHEYARRMREGWDRDTSNPYFRALAGEVTYIWEVAGDAIPAESAKPMIERMRRLLDELRTAYDAS